MTQTAERAEWTTGISHQLEMRPTQFEALLGAEPAEQTGGTGADRARTALWHRVGPRPGIAVRVRSLERERISLVRLSVRCALEEWDPAWVRWSFARRHVPELAGGRAIEAQDVVADDGSALTLLLLPDETREARLRFEPALDGRTLTGDYPFEVVAHDLPSPSGDGVVGEETLVAAKGGTLLVRHPPSPSLRALPSVYSEALTDLRSLVPGYGYEEPPFFARYLRGFDDALDGLNARISRLHEHFDAYAAPPDFLPWLATWVALVLDENWPEMKRRRLIREAVELYGWRGTRRGLRRYLEIYAGVAPLIDDRPVRGMRLGSQATLGVDAVLGDVPDHTFVVTLAVPDPSAINEQTVRDIIESVKPAHAEYRLTIMRAADGAADTPGPESAARAPGE